MTETQHTTPEMSASKADKCPHPKPTSCGQDAPPLGAPCPPEPAEANAKTDPTTAPPPESPPPATRNPRRTPKAPPVRKMSASKADKCPHPKPTSCGLQDRTGQYRTVEETFFREEPLADAQGYTLAHLGRLEPHHLMILAGRRADRLLAAHEFVKLCAAACRDGHPASDLTHAIEATARALDAGARIATAIRARAPAIARLTTRAGCTPWTAEEIRTIPLAAALQYLTEHAAGDRPERSHAGKPRARPDDHTTPTARYTAPTSTSTGEPER